MSPTILALFKKSTYGTETTAEEFDEIDYTGDSDLPWYSTWIGSVICKNKKKLTVREINAIIHQHGWWRAGFVTVDNNNNRQEMWVSSCGHSFLNLAYKQELLKGTTHLEWLYVAVPSIPWRLGDDFSSPVEKLQWEKSTGGSDRVMILTGAQVESVDSALQLWMKDPTKKVLL